MLQLAPERPPAAEMTKAIGGRPCGICDKPGGGFLGLRVAGRWSELPARFRRYLWHCSDPACVAQAGARRTAATVAAGLAAPPRPPDMPAPATPPARPTPPTQAGLFGD